MMRGLLLPLLLSACSGTTGFAGLDCEDGPHEVVVSAGSVECVAACRQLYPNAPILGCDQRHGVSSCIIDAPVCRPRGVENPVRRTGP